MGSAGTTFGFTAGEWVGEASDVLILPVCQQKEGFGADARLKALDAALGGNLLSAMAEEKFEGKRDQVLAVRKGQADSLSARRVVMVGLGERDKLTPDKVEKFVQKGVASVLKLAGLKKIVIAVPEGGAKCSERQGIQAIVDAVYSATYVSQESKEPGPELDEAVLWLDHAATEADRATLWEGEVLSQAKSFAKDLVNRPANLKTTETLVEAAMAVGELENVSVSVISDVDWIEKEMPSFYAVARGSLATDPPKFIRVSYRPEGEVRRRIALVGKSVIFDTGGYQVKPGDSMLTMKGDMTGGAMVLGAVRALAMLQVAGVEVTAYAAATPNKIDSDAMLPDSIVGSACGKKVEIRHTDAEGRMTLIDAVSKAGEEKPDLIVTMATLTGAAMRAVGSFVALMGSDEAWRGRMQAAARSLGEPMQALDVVEEDYEDIKSKLDGADIINTSRNKNRGAMSAAAFVMSGAPEGVPVVHMDIAGADMTGDEKATGIGQRALIRFVLDIAAE